MDRSFLNRGRGSFSSSKSNLRYSRAAVRNSVSQSTSKVDGAQRTGGARSLVAIQILFALSILAATFGGAPRAVDVLFTPIAFIIGIYIYFSSSPQYISYCIWLWMLTPFVRRVVDFGIGFQPQSMVMLAPFVVGLICVITVLRNIHSISIPYWIILLSVFLAALFGLSQVELSSVILGVLDWIVPLFLGLHILSQPETVEDHARRTFDAFTYGTLIIGSYGAWQFFYLPTWDALWSINSAMASLGRVEAGSIRIFSTMNSPGVFAIYIMAGLSVCLFVRSRIKFVAIPFGALSFILTMVRSAWGGFAVSAIFIFINSSLREKVRYSAMLSVSVVIVMTFFASGDVYDKFESRINTVFNLENDVSYQARADFYYNMSETVSSMIVGEGIGRTGRASKLGGKTDFVSFDNGILDVMFTFGVFGVFIFISVGMICLRAIRASTVGPYASGAAAIALAALSQMVFLNVLAGPPGVIFHVFSAIAIAYTAPVRQGGR